MAEYFIKNSPHRQPTHPGAILREDVLPAMGISVSEFARRIGVSRQMLHRILAESHGITPETALRAASLSAMAPTCGCACSRTMTCGRHVAP